MKLARSVAKGETNCLCNFVSSCRTARRRLGGELFKALSHRNRALGARGPRDSLRSTRTPFPVHIRQPRFSSID